MNRLSRSAAVTASGLMLFGLAAAPASTAAPTAGRAAYIVVLKDSVADPGTVSGRHTRRYGGARTAVFRHALKGYAATMTPSQATALKGDPSVRFVTKERTYRIVPPSHQKLLRSPSSRCKEDQGGDGQCLPDWADRVNADLSSTRSGDGQGSVDVNVAVIDSGITGNHPDLNVRGGTDCLTGTPVSPGGSLSDPAAHGTEVAGVVAAKDDDSGVVGVAPGAPLWAVKAFPDDPEAEGSDMAVLCALDWVTSTRTDDDPANDIAVANMSFGGEDIPQGADDGRCGTVNQDAFHLAVCNAVRAGVTLVASAGNEHFDLSRKAPAAYDEVITATAMADFDGKPGGRAAPDCYGLDLGFFGHADDQATLEFSNFARSSEDRRHTVAAPGVCIETTAPDARYTVVDGTSFASPAVTGVVALCIERGNCGATTPVRNLRTIVNDAKTFNQANPRYGFFGDPLHPIQGRYYGHLVAADRY